MRSTGLFVHGGPVWSAGAPRRIRDKCGQNCAYRAETDAVVA
jgi:hypothetical protein